MTPWGKEGVTVRLGDILQEFDERLGEEPEPEILTLTERNGFISQRERFQKRLAVEDTSHYKVIGLHDIAFNPYLLWASAIAQNERWDRAIISPLYPTFHVLNNYDPRFVNYILHSEELRTRYDSISFGSIPRKRRATVVDFLNLRVPRPPSLVEQSRIASVLDEAQMLRERRVQATAKIAKLKETLFLHMFGDPVSNPKGWPDSTLGGVLTFQQYGPRFYNEAYSAEGMRIVRITDLDDDGRLDFDSMPRLSVSADDRAKYALRPGDLIFARTGATVGKVALIEEGDPPCIAGAYFILMRFVEDVDPLYVRAVLTSPSVRSIISRHSQQAAQQNFSGPSLRQLPMPRPPIALQRRFRERVEAIRVVQEAQDRSGKKLVRLLASLQHRAFRGEL
jgi:type I restriction enzyme, S subunit